MDSLTHVVLGAAVGEAVAGKKEGNKAVFWGAVANTLPDLDALISSALSMATVDSQLFHRGPSHSIVLAVVVSFLLGPLLRRLYHKDEATWREWTALVFLGMITHSLLDSFTTWGTELFWPFSDYRVEFSSIFVIDPLFTIPFLICVVIMMFKRKGSRGRRRLNTIGLGFAAVYLSLTVLNKMVINGVFEDALHTRSISYTSCTTSPTPFNNILWYGIAETADGYYLGHYSHFDKAPISFTFHPRNAGLLEPVRGIPTVEELLKFTKHKYIVKSVDSGYTITDLRFGQATGWKDPNADFTFVYLVRPVYSGGTTKVKVTQVRQSRDISMALVQEFVQRIFGREFLYPSADTVRTGP